MAYIYDLTDTWSAAGTVFNGIKLNVTNTASASGSKLVTLQIGGTEHFSVTKDGVGYFSGNVGIGTSSPLAGFRLDVSGSANASGSFISGGGTTNQAQIGNKVLLFYNTSVGEGLIQSADDASTFNSMGIDKTTLRFLTNNSERMRIDSSGNVGIGTSSPERLLDAAGTARFRGDVDMFASVGGAVNSIFQYFGSAALPRAAAIYSKTDTATAGNLVLATSQSGTGTITERMRIDSVGNVGIGTSSPTKKLSIETTPSAPTNGFNIQYSGSEVASFTSNAGTGEIRIGATGTGTYFPTFYSSNTERMRIDSSGNLLVGKTSTANSTTTDGFMIQRAASGGGTVTYITNGGTGSAFAVGVQADTNAVLFYRSGTFVGSISVTGSATAYNTSSDYRLKDIDGPIANSGAYIDALNPVQGSWKADGSRFIGLLAHEVQEVSETPIATGEKDGEEMQAMDYSAPELIANLIAELQSLRARVAQLEGN